VGDNYWIRYPHTLKRVGYWIGVSVKLASLFLKVAFIYCFLYYSTRYYSEGSSVSKERGPYLVRAVHNL
jgi:hypothetical protein